MILFPRREGKPKRGEINDSTAEQLKSAAAGNQVSGHVLPITKAVSAVETGAVSSQLANFKAFRTQRTLRTVKKFKGRREARAKKAAEENKNKKEE
jgi:large subunit ribosomal protein L13e